jgi:hypothetical protein
MGARITNGIAFNEGSKRIIKFIMRWRKAMEISSPMVEIVGSVGICIGMVYAWATKMDFAEFTAVKSRSQSASIRTQKPSVGFRCRCRSATWQL